MANGRIERWITTDEGNHLPIIDGKISGGGGVLKELQKASL